MKKITKLSDERVVELVREKDQELYSEIIRRYQDKLMRYAVYLTQDYHQASDIVQDTFIKAFINLNGFNVKQKFSSWIYRITHNEAMNAVKKDKKQTALLDEMNFSADENIEDDVIKKEELELVRDCLGELPLGYREPLALHYFEEKSYEEISDILKIPVGTVGTKIHRAKLIMKKVCLKKQ